MANRDELLEQLRTLATSEGLSSSGNDTWLIDGWRIGVAPDSEPRFLRFKDGKLGELTTIDDVAAFLASRQESRGDDDPFAGAPAPPPVRERLCAQCATPLAHDAMFCQECGARQRADAPILASPTMRTNGLAIASLVVGLIGGSVIAIILGIVALRQIKRSQGTQEGRGMAIAGVVLGAIGTVVFAVILSFAVLFVSTVGEAVNDAAAELVLTSTVNIARTAAAGDDMTAATPATLATFDPTVAYVGKDHESTSMSIVSVDAPTNTEFVAAIRSQSGSCVFARYTSTTDVTEWNYTDDASCMSGSAPTVGWTTPSPGVTTAP